MKSTYSRLNASGVSQSCYDSQNRQHNAEQAHNVTAISPMPNEPAGSNLNFVAMSRFDRSELLKDKGSQYDGLINCS